MVFIQPEAQKFLDLNRDAPQLDTRTPEENRAAQQKTAAAWGKKTPMVSVYETSVRGVTVRVYVPQAPALADAPAAPAFIFFHGGGWVLGDLETTDTTVRDIAAEAGIICISVHYRRAPEHPFPAPLDDCRAVVDGVLQGELGIGIDPTRVAVGGDSAGGNIAAVIAQELRDQLAHQVLIYPVMDLSTFDTQSHSDFSDGYYLTRRRLNYFYDSYAGAADRTDIRMSPGRNGDLAGLPPATVITGELDPLVSEVSDYVGRMLNAGNVVSSIEFKGQVHPFVQMGGIISDALIARTIIGSELKRALRGQG
ncbi:MULTISPECIES: alpha/beta hydrolase [Corynebacterium]|jgi:esterase/lipase protein|uniref:alpha/beta hydrolase n=1 Tax=Corynebacterium TaxID=1716 RepID=UPI001EF6BD28|nr:MULTISPECIES: alpha/beta hydrolase [Corynebacterium]MCG7243223.1 alpha/beta hydrolase [Corynebacterium sp. ACRPS]MCG7271251.1 alpha/beta hydrolase [Corynebacterium sp. ACRQM]MCG7233635.1 alpha/beta hydrolase [Corynebacterium sp. ACRPR]MDK8474476.1 alpha/beta hydrolase [Corynebacterium sp. MSK078]MDK8659812.1 alpha/beta hydrolase [Corynebacterium sp. MSK204]